MRIFLAITFLFAHCKSQFPMPTDAPQGTQPCENGKVWWNGAPHCGYTFCDGLYMLQQEIIDITTDLCLVPNRAGCYCPAGYTEYDYPSKCIKEEDCDVTFQQKVTDATRHMKLCKVGSNQRFDCPCAEAKCSDPSTASCTSIYDVNGLQCDASIVTCVCNPGFLRNSIGNCVRKTECGPICIAKETLFSQGGACEKTCLHPQGGNYCTQGTEAVCFCSVGFVRDPTTNQCVRGQRCPPPTCGTNEVFVKRGRPLSCQLTCKNIDNPMTCTAPRSPNCQCEIGFYRDDDNKCASLENCRKCAANEVFKCACGDGKVTNTRIPSCKKCKHDCYCKFGSFRNPTGSCVSEEDK